MKILELGLGMIDMLPFALPAGCDNSYRPILTGSIASYLRQRFKGKSAKLHI